MKYIYKSRVLTALMAVCAFLFCSMTVKAEMVDLGSLEPGVTYSFPQYKGVKANYTPTQSGPVRFLWTCSPLTLYSSPDHNEESIVGGQHAYTQNGQLMSYSYLEAGHTYYIYAEMCIMSGELVITEGDSEIKLVHSEPCLNEDDADYYGGAFSISKNYRIYLDFNIPVTVGNCLLIAGEEREKVNPFVNGTNVSFDVNDVIMNFYRSGAIAKGSKLTLRVLQVKDASNDENKYGESGRLELEFTMADKPAEVVDTEGFSFKSVSNPFCSYYLPGDESGVMKLIFDRTISSGVVPQADVTYGNPDNLDLGIHRETIYGTVNDSVVAFDFTGKLRRRIDMIPEGDPAQLPTAFYVSYNNIYTEDGQRAYTGAISNPTGFAASYIINELQYTIAADFVPARGTALKPGDAFEIWVMNGSQIQYEDICIDYMENGESKTIAVGKENITETIDSFSASGNDMLYNFTTPEFNADPESEVAVYMKGLICADGLDHSDDVRGNFKSATSGVAGIEADENGVSDVYDITGKRVLKSATRSQISGLDKGIYIVDGKKMVVR